jgi:ABC-type sugar transport system ATPase subunit
MISLDKYSVQRGGFTLPPVTLAIPRGAYAVLMGPTGCGKTSLLEGMVGLASVISGRLLVNGADLTYVSAAARHIGYVPQDSVLFAGLTVAENMGFGLKMRGWKPPEIHARVGEISQQLNVSHLLARGVSGLSGGEKQRVAIGRALAFRPEVLLLDEPLAALDEATKLSLCQLLKSLPDTYGTTVLHVTHSASEAELLATMRLEFGAFRL